MNTSVTTIERPETVEAPIGNVDFDLDEQPPYTVILHNDDVNGMDFVVKVLRKVFGYGMAKSASLMIQAHMHGSAVVWSGSLEVAELRAEQVVSCGPDPHAIKPGAGPLRVTVEPVPR